MRKAMTRMVSVHRLLSALLRPTFFTFSFFYRNLHLSSSFGFVPTRAVLARSI